MTEAERKPEFGLTKDTSHIIPKGNSLRYNGTTLYYFELCSYIAAVEHLPNLWLPNRLIWPRIAGTIAMSSASYTIVAITGNRFTPKLTRFVLLIDLSSMIFFFKKHTFWVAHHFLGNDVNVIP